jgi:hypothetical protein
VSVDGANPGVRRTCTLTLAAVPGLWEMLAPIGTELKVWTAIRFPSGKTEAVPQGVFPIDVQRISYGPDGSLSLTAPDGWVRVQNGRFFTPRQFGGGGDVRALISQLLQEVLPANAPITNVGSNNAPIPVLSEDKDRAGLIQKLAKAGSLDVYFDREGTPIIRDAPEMSAQTVWDVDAGPKGVMISADRERNRQKTYNIVVVNGTKNDDGTPPFPTQYVWDANPNSPTYAGPGTGAGDTPPPQTLAGPFGQRPTFYASPLLTSAAQAQKAGLTILQRVTGLAAQLKATAVSNPALDDGDTIRVQLPKEGRNRRQVELHIIDSLTVPLVPSKNAQSISTRSTRADDTGDVD